MLPAADATLTELAIKGKTTREIGKVLGVSHQTICNNLKRSDIQDIINATTYDIIRRGAKAACNTLLRLAALGNLIGRKTADGLPLITPDWARLSLDASTRILQAATIMPGNGSNTVINILNANTHDIPPVVADMLRHIGNQAQPAAVEGNDE